jgi:hypothetical protein
MKIKQIIVDNGLALIFTENAELDILELKKAYEDRDEKNYKFPLGYEEPELTDYEFLGEKYKCISLWFDNEDIPKFFTEFRATT